MAETRPVQRLFEDARGYPLLFAVHNCEEADRIKALIAVRIPEWGPTLLDAWRASEKVERPKLALSTCSQSNWGSRTWNDQVRMGR
jgi:hypothetical protein